MNKNKKVVKVQDNEFNCEGRPTDQEDNFGQINNRWDLYIVYNVDGKATKVGYLIEHMNGSFTVFHNAILYRFPKEQVKFY